jgi:hypothetical protein
MRRWSDAEEILKEEIQEKKQIGNITQTRKGKRGYGRMKTTLDFLSGKEKRAYTKAGKVQVSNLYEKLLTKAEFEELSPEDQKRRILHWRTKHKVKDIQRALGVSNLTYYKYLENLGIPKERGRKGKAQTIAAAPQPEARPAIRSNLEFAEELQPRAKTYMELLEYPDIETDFPELAKVIAAEKAAEKAEPAPEPAPAILLLDGLNVAYNGRYGADEIRRMLTKIDVILDGEENEFDIELRISERKERTE